MSLTPALFVSELGRTVMWDSHEQTHDTQSYQFLSI